MPYEFDHAVIFVPDLNHAIDNFTKLGFHVQLGGSHGFTHNALIPFKDQTYIELIAHKSNAAKYILLALNKWFDLRRSHNDIMARLVNWFSRPSGPIDWCLRQDSVDDKTALPINTTPRKKFSRTKPDGVQVNWELWAPIDHNLPMFIKDEKSPDNRIPEYKAGLHKNGAASIKAVIVSGEKFTKIAAGLSLKNIQDQQGLEKLQLGNVSINPSQHINPAFQLVMKFAAPSQNQTPDNPIIDIPAWLIYDPYDEFEPK